MKAPGRWSAVTLAVVAFGVIGRSKPDFAGPCATGILMVIGLTLIYTFVSNKR